MDIRGNKISLAKGPASLSVLIPSGTDYADLLWFDDSPGGVAIYAGSYFESFQGQPTLPARVDWQVLGGSPGACLCDRTASGILFHTQQTLYLWDTTPAASGSTFLQSNLNREGLIFQCGLAGSGGWLIRGRNNSGAALKISLTAVPLRANCCCSLSVQAGTMIG